MLMYIANRMGLFTTSYSRIVNYFLHCYFNDVIGGMVVMFCVDLIISLAYTEFYLKYWHVLLIILGCGVFWEYVTPLYRKDSVSDIFDIVAYVVGGILFWKIQSLIKADE